MAITNTLPNCTAARAKTSAAMRAQIEAAGDSDWLPLLDKQGEATSGQDTYRTSF